MKTETKTLEKCQVQLTVTLDAEEVNPEEMSFRQLLHKQVILLELF